jgi:hypothetical protein
VVANTLLNLDEAITRASVSSIEHRMSALEELVQ